MKDRPEKEYILQAYSELMVDKGLLYLRSRPWRERVKANPWRTIWYAIVDRFWYVVIDITGRPLLVMRTFWGAKIVMKFPDYRCVLHHGLIDSRELPVEDFLITNLHSGDVFMDIGANVGFYSLLCEALGAKVYAFEPSPETFDILEKNMSADITLVNKALMDTGGKIKFTDKGIASGVNTAVMGGADMNCIEVDAVTLDSYCTENNVRPTFLKIDVEGAEYSVIRGGVNTISLHKPTMVIETKDEDLVAFVCSLGYNAFRFGTRGEIIPYAMSAVYSPNLLFQPI